jgi:tRNA 2-thiocytidine biosynthesis protein TtcA
MKNTAFRKIIRLVGKAIGDFSLIEDGDRVLVALSGGKDSWSLLHALRELQRKAPVRFELGAVTINPGKSVFETEPLVARLAHDRVRHHIIQGNIVEVVDQYLTKGTNPCAFCARLRRGILYSYAAREGWNKIALGHHLDDFVETLLLNLLFNGTIKGMSPHLKADDGRNIIVRPLVYVMEEMTRTCARELDVPIVECSCSFDESRIHRREWVKSLLATIETEVPGAKSSVLAAMGRVHHRHLLTTAAWDFPAEQAGSGRQVREITHR